MDLGPGVALGESPAHALSLRRSASVRSLLLHVDLLICGPLPTTQKLNKFHCHNRVCNKTLTMLALFIH